MTSASFTKSLSSSFLIHPMWPNSSYHLITSWISASHHQSFPSLTLFYPSLCWPPLVVPYTSAGNSCRGSSGFLITCQSTLDCTPLILSSIGAICRSVSLVYSHNCVLLLVLILANASSPRHFYTIIIISSLVISLLSNIQLHTPTMQAQWP